VQTLLSAGLSAFTAFSAGRFSLEIPLLDSVGPANLSRPAGRSRAG
jgi:hypothetical protein